ncbi:hypothetical protein PHMEG_00019497 [Phytophthora megakarya]|uniref:Cleavage induced protein n=1 Tax=Phytophthora megakarya TaxID=4795 RepID=A0A225VTA9_9STRA|nr:hypothetical protein PHMEG_00019497 [Phytophthora megakarya]
MELPAVTSIHQGTLDQQRIMADSQVARRSGLHLSQFVRIYRHQTSSDSRPHKDLFELPTSTDPSLCDMTDRWNAIVREGVRPEQLLRPPNHKTINAHVQHVRDHIRKGQRDGHYLVVEADLLDEWPEIFISPIGVVDKSQSSTATRLINDYPYPDGASVNEFTECINFPEVSYNPPRDIARQIVELRARFPGHPILMMLGDVSGAFRHIPQDADHVHMFAFRFEGYIVIDLVCGFGWCGSPAYYSVAGSLINNLYQNQQPERSLAPLDSSKFTGNI